MGKISSLEVLRLRAIKRASPDKSVTRSAQDDDFVVSWRCKKQRLLGFLLSARQVSAYAGLRPTQGDEKSLRPATTLYRTVAFSFVIPSVPGFPTSQLPPATTHVVLSKENHTQLTEAATLDRKSGGARPVPPLPRPAVGHAVQGSAVPR